MRLVEQMIRATGSQAGVLTRNLLIRTLRNASSSTPPLQTKNWKADTVYLYQFPRSPVVPNLSPYCLKTETFLRAKTIPHEVCFTYTKRSKFGLLPFVELNGEHITDSQLILQRLQKHFNKHDDLSPEQSAIARAVDRMIEGSTVHPLMYARVVENTERMLSREVSGLPVPGFVVRWILAPRFQKVAKKRMQGIGKFSRDERADILRRDLQAVDAILDTKDFICGPIPTLPDFTLFGHLASCYYLPYRQPIQDLLDDDFPRVKHHMERIRSHFWQDWKLA